jgi:hypothetical protein
MTSIPEGGEGVEVAIGWLLSEQNKGVRACSEMGGFDYRLISPVAIVLGK